MTIEDYITVIRYAWKAYDDSRSVKSITDISAKVSTNHVYKVVLEDDTFVIAKLSYFGKFEYFLEDHTIISALSNNLPAPFDNFLARSLMKGSSLFVHRYINDEIDAWVVFYLPVRMVQRLPRRLDEAHIINLAEQFARFHLTCSRLRRTLPHSSKTLRLDIEYLLDILDTREGKKKHGKHVDLIKRQCNIFLENVDRLRIHRFEVIPVFVDWNIGNFSVTPSGKLFSRWDYDWFRMSSRTMDFYFFSRVVSDVGDRTVFSYNIGTLMEDRFIVFLKKYHQIFPLRENEIRFLKDAYRFFILNYVINHGSYFFHKKYADKLEKEAYDFYFPSIDKIFDADKLLKEVLG